MANSTIPRPVIGIIAETLYNSHTHAELDNLFFQADAPGDSPTGNKLVKCQEWLHRCNKDTSVDALKVLGALIEDFMERDIFNNEWCNDSTWREEREKQRDNIRTTLNKCGLCYVQGGHIYKVGCAGAIQSLEQILRDKNFTAVEEEFQRALEAIELDPPASLTAACAIIEAICKAYVEDKHLAINKDLSIKPLWATVANDLGFDPKIIEDNDLRKILTGLNSIVDEIGALRTHAGSAHGHGELRYNIQPRHARLAVHAAHTLAVFVIESWDNKKTT